MTTCKIPPKGWTCSRAAGHDGPCAAYADKPYDEYADHVLSEITFMASVTKDGYGEIKIGEYYTPIDRKDLRAMLADAWLAGLAYSLNLIETEKGKRDVHTT